jgi:hypothetical protein
MAEVQDWISHEQTRMPRPIPVALDHFLLSATNIVRGAQESVASRRFWIRAKSFCLGDPNFGYRKEDCVARAVLEVREHSGAGERTRRHTGMRFMYARFLRAAGNIRFRGTAATGRGGGGIAGNCSFTRSARITTRRADGQQFLYFTLVNAAANTTNAAAAPAGPNPQVGLIVAMNWASRLKFSN